MMLMTPSCQRATPNLYVAEENLWSLERQGGIFLTDGSIKANNYEAYSLLFGGYGMFSFSVWERRLTVRAGARYEATDMQLESKDQSLDRGKLALQDVLPALLATVRLRGKSTLKSSYGRTVARPTFRELAPYSAFDFVGGYVLQGNPNLERTLIDNLDLRYEYYPSSTELLSFGTFFKRFTDPIERTFNPQASNTELTYRNADEAYVVGGELEVIKRMGALFPWLKGVQAGGNFSYLYSRVAIDEKELEVY